MAEDVSSFGAVVTLFASQTFPSGITLTEFADDADPFDLPKVAIAATAVNINGNLVKWGKANALKFTLNMIPGSDDDQNLAAIFDANRVGPGRIPAGDEITITVSYPQGNTLNLIGGAMTEGTPGASAANSGKLKSKAYDFEFEDFNRS